MYFQPFCPTQITFCTPEEFYAHLRSLLPDGLPAAVFCSRASQRRTGIGPRIPPGTAVYTDIPANPDIADLFQALKALRDLRLERIVAVGGGSCIDLAKAVCALWEARAVKSPAALRAMVERQAYRDLAHPVELIAAPTTAGTGSEATRWATLWDRERQRKWSVEHPDLYPKAGFLVPAFTESMPARLTLSTGLDALSHAMEAFWAKSRAPLSQELALLSMRKIHDHLEPALRGPNPGARRELCMASLLAGLAFSSTRTTACHSISYPLTLRFGIEHGFAAALTLQEVARRNRVPVPEIARIWEVFGGEDAFGDWLRALTAPIQPLTLAALGIEPGQIHGIAQQAITLGRMDNNPIAFSPEQVEQILEQVQA